MHTPSSEVDSGLELAVLAGDAMKLHALPSQGQVLIGRTMECDIHIADASVSRRHATLHLGARVQIEDLHSANGTYVHDPHTAAGEGDTRPLRGCPGERLALAPGDHVVFGAVLAVLRERRASAAGGGAQPGHGERGVLIDAPAMRALHAQARRAARGTLSVLILGETGVGKEVLAREIHRMSPRAAGPFLALNCAALPETLLEGELFGHERGAFSGATQARPGLFEAADGGTVLLDEIGELPASAQVRLLRVLEERAVMRLGARAPRAIDVRFVAATNRDLEAETARKAFRGDLLFRLNAVTLTIPPLRERVAELQKLAELFLAGATRQLGHARVPALSSEALALMLGYPWPGNLRELRNAMERAAALCEGEAILPEHLPPRVARPGTAANGEAEARTDLSTATAMIEKRRIEEALERCGGNQTRAAGMLSISRRTLVSRLGEYGMPRPRKRG